MRRRKQKDAGYEPVVEPFPDFGWESFGADTPGEALPGTDAAAPQGVKAFNAAALAFSLIGGLAGAALAVIFNRLVIRGLLESVLNLRLCSVLMIGSAMMLTGCGALAGLYLSRAFYPARLRLNPAAGVIAALAAAALLAAGCLMQFLYSLGGVSAAVPADDYIFVIDDSGSMAGTDPENARVTSMQYLMNRLTPENRIGMIFFSDGVSYESPLSPVSEAKLSECAQAVSQLRSSGGTNLNGAIFHALGMPGAENPERLTEIVLLTDGESRWVRKKQIAKLCAEYNVRVSAIALSDAVNARVLQKITRITGGALYPVTELDGLTDAYSKVGVVSNVRDLLGLRTGADHGNLWLALLRLLSWALMGAIAGLAMMLAVRGEPRHVPLVTAGAGLAFGAVLEILNLMWWSGMNGNMLLIPMVCIPVLFYRKEPACGLGGISVGWTQQEPDRDAERLNSNQGDDKTIYRL